MGTVQANQIMPRYRTFSGTDKATFLAFAIIAVTAVLNLNGLVAMALGVGRVFTVAFTACSLLLISQAWVNGAIGISPPLRAFMGMLIVYNTIGMFSTGGYKDDELGTYLQAYIGTFLVVYAAYIGTYKIVPMVGFGRFLFWFTLLLFASSATVFLTPVLADTLYARLPNQAWDVETRASGFFANPNEAGAAACLACVFAYAGLQARELRNRAHILWAIIAISGIVTVLTFSRTAILNYLVASAYFVAVMTKGVTLGRLGPRQMLFPLACGGILLIGALWFLFMDGWKFFDFSQSQIVRITSIKALLTGEEHRNLDGSRGELFWVGYNYWMKSPFVGHGLGSMRHMRGLGGVHNTWLMIAGEAGVFALIAFFCAVVAYWREVLRNRWDLSVRFLVVGYGLVFLFASIAGHNLLEHRNQNVCLGVSLGMMALCSRNHQVR